MKRAVTALLAAGLIASAIGATTSLAQRGSHGQTPGVVEESGLAALSHQEVEDLLAGKGMGFARPAEANGYPGPLHVMELDAKLELTSEQRRAAQVIFVKMKTAAMGLGAKLVEAETKLESAFRGGTATPEVIKPLAAEAERLRAELRLVHLNAHIEMTPVLTPRQITAYREARGASAQPQPSVPLKPRGSH